MGYLYDLYKEVEKLFDQQSECDDPIPFEAQSPLKNPDETYRVMEGFTLYLKEGKMMCDVIRGGEVIETRQIGDVK